MWELSGGHLNLRQTACKLNFLKNTQHDVKEKQKKNQRLFHLVSSFIIIVNLSPKVTIQ